MECFCGVPLEGGGLGHVSTDCHPQGKTSFPELQSVPVQLSGLSWLWRNVGLILEVGFWKHLWNYSSEVMWLVHTDIHYSYLHIHNPWSWGCLSRWISLFLQFLLKPLIMKVFCCLWGRLQPIGILTRGTVGIPKRKGQLASSSTICFHLWDQSVERKVLMFPDKMTKASIHDLGGPGLHLGGVLIVQLMQGTLRVLVSLKMMRHKQWIGVFSSN